MSNLISKNTNGLITSNEIQELINDLKENCTARASKSIDLILRICLEQVQRNSRDFSIATIGRVSESSGGLTEQALRNKGGERYRRIISAFEKQYGSPIVNKNVPIKNDSWVDRIEEHEIRWLVNDLIAENRNLKNENDTLKSNIDMTVDLRDITDSSSDQALLSVTLSGSEKASIEHFLSDGMLTDNEWKIDNRGKLIVQGGESITKAGFADAIAKIKKML